MQFLMKHRVGEKHIKEENTYKEVPKRHMLEKEGF